MNLTTGPSKDKKIEEAIVLNMPLDIFLAKIENIM